MAELITFSLSKMLYNRIFPVGYKGNKSERIRDLIFLGFENELGNIDKINLHRKSLITECSIKDEEIRNLKRDLGLANKRYSDLKEEEEKRKNRRVRVF